MVNPHDRTRADYLVAAPFHRRDAAFADPRRAVCHVSWRAAGQGIAAALAEHASRRAGMGEVRLGRADAARAAP